MNASLARKSLAAFSSLHACNRRTAVRALLPRPTGGRDRCVCTAAFPPSPGRDAVHEEETDKNSLDEVSAAVIRDAGGLTQH